VDELFFVVIWMDMYRGPAALFVVPDCHKISRLPTPCCASPATLLTSEQKKCKSQKETLFNEWQTQTRTVRNKPGKKGQQEAVGIV